MSTEGDELGRFKPVPDALVLAAVQRAERHDRKHVPDRLVAEHLGFAHGTTRRLRPQLDSLRVAGSLGRTRKRGQEVWTLTSTGSRSLGAAPPRGQGRRAARVPAAPALASRPGRGRGALRRRILVLMQPRAAAASGRAGGR